MEYLVHFEDGSNGYLAHHGIKGMKWGVWNEETKRRHAGAKFKDPYEGLTPRKEVYKAANAGQIFGNKLAEKYSDGSDAPNYSDKNWSKVTKAIRKETSKYDDVDAFEGKAKNFEDAAYAAAMHGKNKKLAGEYYLMRLLGDEKRTPSLDKADKKISNAAKKQREVSARYGANSKQNKKALAKYAKAKSSFEKRYAKLNPERANFYKELD